MYISTIIKQKKKRDITFLCILLGPNEDYLEEAFKSHHRLLFYCWQVTPLHPPPSFFVMVNTALWSVAVR